MAAAWVCWPRARLTGQHPLVHPLTLQEVADSGPSLLHVVPDFTIVMTSGIIVLHYADLVWGGLCLPACMLHTMIHKVQCANGTGVL